MPALRNVFCMAYAAPSPDGSGAVGWYASAEQPHPEISARGTAPNSSAQCLGHNIITPAASPKFIPSLHASKGLDLPFESSSREPNPFSVILDRESAPHTTAASSHPCSIALHAAAKASEELEQAVENAMHGPAAPVRFATNSARVEHS
ncbi:unknown [Coraliomargarita sp. CAG:312]|nr:unknown [Coraliomargarita sp. CAG:312]